MELKEPAKPGETSLVFLNSPGRRLVRNDYHNFASRIGSGGRYPASIEVPLVFGSHDPLPLCGQEDYFKTQSARFEIAGFGAPSITGALQPTPALSPEAVISLRRTDFTVVFTGFRLKG